MPRYGVIIETDSGRAIIKTSRRGICAECSDKASCSFESALGKDAPEEVRAQNPINARAGDHVEFDLPGRTELKLSLMIWGLPIAGLIAGAVTGARLHPILSLSSDAAALLGAVAGLVLSIVPLVIYDRLVKNDQRLVPVIIRRANPASCPDRPGDS
jgi:sigma-E factor negative regulatory protein RseC